MQQIKIIKKQDNKKHTWWKGTQYVQKKTFKIYNNLLKIIKHKKEHIRMYESDNRH